jgi:hypothetical protein
MPNVKKSKSMDKMPARRMPEGVEFSKNKKAVPNPPGVQRTPASGTKKTMPKKPAVKRTDVKPAPLPKKTTTPKPTKKPEKMTPQDAAMKKLLEKKYGKIYG